MKLCFILPYLKISIAFFLFESASTLPTSPSPLKEHQMWLFLVHILFVCFFWFSSVLVSLLSLSIFYALDMGKWIDQLISQRDGLELVLVECTGKYVCTVWKM